MKKLTTEQLRQIESTLDIRGDVEIVTVPIRLDGYWIVVEGNKFIFLHQDLTPAKREDLIQRGLRQIADYDEGEVKDAGK